MTREQYDRYTGEYINTLHSLKKSPSTIESYKRATRIFGEFLDQQKQEITPYAVSSWRNSLSKSDIKPNTVKQYMVNLRTFFSWCERMKLIEHSLVTAEDMPKPEPVEYDLLTYDEIQMLLHQKPKGIFSKTACRNRAIVVLLLQAGLRNSEIRSLKPKDLDFESGTVTVMHGKGNKNRTAPFPSLAREAVAEYLTSGIRPAWATDDDVLFGTDADENGQSTDGREWHEISGCGLLTMINRYTARVCGHAVGVHTLRHAAASLWDDMGIHMRDIQNALGHASIATTEKVYVKILNKAKSAHSINAAFDSFSPARTPLVQNV